jgi:lipoprotein-releasing system permease protein
MRAPGFEWFVAWRHLRDPERRSRRTLVVGVVLLALGLLALGVAGWAADRVRAPEGFLPPRPPLWTQHLRLGGMIAAIAGGIVSYLGLLFATFTVFTAISVFGVFLGTAAPIIALSVMSGFEADLKGKIRGAKADVVVTRADDRPFTEWNAVREKLATLPDVRATTPYIAAEVLVKAGAPAGVVLRGIDPASAGAVLDLGKGVGRIDDLAHPERVAKEEQTRWSRRGVGRGLGGAPPPGDATGGRPADGEVAASGAGPANPDAPAEADPPAVLPTIILGEELYRSTLRVYVGSEVDVVCPLCDVGPAGPQPRMREFRVAGHFKSGMYEYDSKYVYISLEEAQRFLRMPGEVTGIDLRTTNPDEADEIAAAAARLLGPQYEVRSWQELNKSLFMALRLEKIAMFIVLTFIALVASFSIVSNLIMLVTEKGREVAILKAMGAGDYAILRVFFAEGLYIGVLGLLVGVGSGVAACKLIERYGLPLPTEVYYIDKLPIVMRAEEILTVAASALVLCCLATIYPALVASRMRPVEGLRYE